jgi:hypothetical protein
MSAGSAGRIPATELVKHLEARGVDQQRAAAAFYLRWGGWGAVCAYLPALARKQSGLAVLPAALKAMAGR